eukprot:6074048-Amphidinium_carterae.1
MLREDLLKTLPKRSLRVLHQRGSGGGRHVFIGVVNFGVRFSRCWRDSGDCRAFSVVFLHFLTFLVKYRKQ